MVYQLACMEVWGGNRKIAREVELPGLVGWVYSAPLEPSSGGGDVCYFSVCDRGLLPVSALYPLAHLGLARAHAVAGNAAQSRRAYQDFFALWKDADPDIPILQQAKTEYAELK